MEFFSGIGGMRISLSQAHVPVCTILARAARCFALRNRVQMCQLIHVHPNEVHKCAPVFVLAHEVTMCEGRSKR